jgi:glycosyltransferase involved in cell wall biosynthesis
MNHITLNKADNLICNSQYIYTQLNKKYKKKAIEINNFLSDDIIKTLSSKQCKKGTDLITVSNGFSYYKNIKKALEAFALLKKNNPNLRYDLVGDDLEEGGKVHSFAMKKNLQHGVRFMGRIPYNEVLDRIKASRVLLHPSLEESFSMSVLEAMYLETMVVGGKNSGNIPYLLQYGKNGILCDVHSTTEIAQSIEKLLKNENDADTYTKNASKFIKEEFSEERQIEKLLSFYNKIA